MPPALATHLDWSQLTLCAGSFVDEHLRERHTDLLFTVPAADNSVLVYVLYEHESSVDRWMPLRLLRYLLRIWDTLQQREPERTLLPPIVPVTIHHSDTGGTAATSFDELLDLLHELRAVVGPFVPSFRFLLDDVSQVPDERLRARAMSAARQAGAGGAQARPVR